MHSLLIAAAFMMMVLSPCVVALFSGATNEEETA